MCGWRISAIGLVWLLLVILGVSAAVAGPRMPSAAAHWVFSGFGGDASKDWDPGFGFSLSGTMPLHRGFELRGDWGGRWLEGGGRLAADRSGQPRWGGPVGSNPSGLRVMPATLSFVHRCERCSHGRFWVPYVGLGPGFYDMRSTYHSVPVNFSSAPALEQWNHNLFRFGWHARAGAYLYRTSGVYLDLGGALHLIDVPGQWSHLWELSLGIGTHLRGRSR